MSDREDAPLEFDRYGMAIDEIIARNDFEEMIRSEVLAIDNCIESTLKDAGLKPCDIDLVFLTGGSSHIPLIRALFENRIGAEKIRIGDAFTSVAYGLGLYGRTLG